MDEQRVRIRSRRRKRLRITAVILAFCLLTTSSPELLETLSVFAEEKGERQGGDAVIFLSRFGALPEETSEQTVPVGTDISGLTLPDTLEAYEAASEVMADEDHGGESAPDNGGEEAAEDVEKPGEEESVEDVEAPEEEEPAEDVEAPEEEEPAEDTETPEEEEPAEDVEAPEEEELTEGAEKPGEGDGDSPDESGDEAAPAFSGDTITEAQKDGGKMESGTGSGIDAWSMFVGERDARETADADTKKEKALTVKGVTWASAPAYDGEQPGDYVFTAVLPEGFLAETGVELPQITVRVVDEEAAVTAYASLAPDEIAPLAERADAEKIEFVSADNAGDRYRVRILWQTIKTVDSSTSTKGCENSWLGFRVPGMDGDQKYYFTKGMLRDSSTAYTLAEFTLPYTYEDREDIFPTQIGAYSAVSLWNGQFRGRITLQSYDYVQKEWESYEVYELSPETALIGGLLADKHWLTLDQPAAWVEYVDVDLDDLYLRGQGNKKIENSWSLTAMDNFGVMVTNNSKVFNGGWKLEKEDGSAYPANYQITVSGDMESFRVTAAAGIENIPEDPYACITFRGRRSGPSVISLWIGLSVSVQKYVLQYGDAKGLVYSETVGAGSSYQVADVRKVSLNQGRELAQPKGGVFAGTYSGSDGKTYKPGDRIAALDGPMNFYMDWKPGTYQVTLDGQIDQNGKRTLTGNKQDKMNLTYGQKGTENAPLPTQAPDGYRFDGWVGEVEGQTEKILFFDKAGKPFNKWYGDESSVLTPRWALNNISYKLDPGAEDAWCGHPGFTWSNPPAGEKPTLAEYGLTFPTDENVIFRYGYDFTGWYTEMNGEGDKVDEYYPLPVEDTTFYAGWKPKKMTLTLDANGGSFSSGTTTVNRGEKVHYEQSFGEIKETLEVPVRTGYDFCGWFTAKKSSGKILSDEWEVSKTTDFTLYAVWHRNDITIYFEPNGGTFAKASDASVQTPANKKVSLPAPTREGYRLMGWQDAAGNVTKGSSYQVGDVLSSFTLTAVWEANTYQLKFDANVGTGNMGTQSLTYDRSFTLPKNQFTRTGYEFTEWNTKKDGSGKVYADGAAVRNLTASNGETITLYAQWKPLAYSVSFDPNGGAFTDKTKSSKTVTYAASYGDLPVPVKDRYIFKGWFTEKTGGEPRTKNSTVLTAEAHTLYAQWEYAWFTLTFDLQGGSGSKEFAFGNMEGEISKGIELPDAIPERAGWEFRGFSISPDAKEADAGYTREKILEGTARVKSGGTTNPNVTLYAVWYTNEPTLSYDSNAGSAASDVEGMPSPIVVKFEDGKVVVASNEPSRTGYTFMGWALTADGDALYKKKGENKAETIYSAVSVTLYAVWQADNAVDADATGGDGIECKYFKDGKWQIRTLATALSEVPDGGEIVMLTDIDGTDKKSNKHLTISAAKNITLDLNGYKLAYDEGLSVDGGKISVKNGAIGSVFEVKNNASVVADTIRFEKEGTYSSVTVGSNAEMTMQGRTILFDTTTKIASRGSLTVEYAEGCVNNSENKAKHLFEVEGSLTINKGYFYLENKNDSCLIYVEPSGSAILNGGYYAGNCNSSNIDENNFGKSDENSGSCVINRTCEGKLADPQPSGTGTFSGVGEVNTRIKTWMIPVKEIMSSEEYWGVYDGETYKKTIGTPHITIDDYGSADTRFKLLRNATDDENVNLSNANRTAGIDLDGHVWTVNGNVELESFSLENGTLNVTNPNNYEMKLTNGRMAGDAVVQATGDVELNGITLEPGATFYIRARNVLIGEKDIFRNKYVDTEFNFGGTKLVNARGIYGDNYTTVYLNTCDGGGNGFRVYVAVPISNGPSVTFHANYPENSSEGEPDAVKMTQEIGVAYKFPTSSFAAPAGYTLDHWNTKADGTGEKIDNTFIYHDRAVADLYAIWRRNYVTVTFDQNGGKWTDTTSLELDESTGRVKRTVPYNMTLGTLPTVSRTGYGFAGWYTEKSGGTQVNATTPITETVNPTYYARWEPADGTKYTAIWQGEDIDGKMQEFDRAERFGKTDDNIQIDSLKQAFDGYTFNGYTVKSSQSASGTTGTGKTFKILADGSVEVTLTYTLNVHKITVTAEKEDALDGAKASLSDVDITLSEKGHVQQNGSTDTRSSMTTDASGKAETYYQYGGSVTLTASEREGYTFAGWSGDYTAAGKSLSFPMSDRDVAVSGLYRQKAYAVEKNVSHITVQDEKVTSSGQTSGEALPAAGVPHGYTYTLTLTANEGYELPERITLRRGTESEVTLTDRESADGGQTYTRAADKTSGTVTVTNVVTPLTVTAKAEAKQYSVSFKGTHVTANRESGNVSHGGALLLNLTAEEGYELPDLSEENGGSLAVKMGGSELTAGENYTYDPGDGSLYIGAVTGNVEITAAALPAYASYRVAYYLQNVDGSYGSDPYETEEFYDKRHGDTVSLLAADSTLQKDYAKTYTGYAFDGGTAGNVTNGTVKIDGSLTMKVYYQRNTYRVSIAEGYAWADGASVTKSYRYGAAVELAVQEKTGYDAGWSGGGLSGLSGEVSFSMPAKDVEITPTYRPQQVSVTEAGLSNVSFDAGTELFGYYEKAYSASIEPLTGYDLPQAITVKVDGKELDGGFTYTPGNGKIEITAEKVTGDIEIIAEGVRQTRQAKVELINNTADNGGVILAASPQSAEMPSGEAFQTRLTVLMASDYALPDPAKEPGSLTVTMGGRTLKAGEDYTYSSLSGLLRVPDVVEDVVVTASPMEKKETASYQIEHYKEAVDGTYTLAQRVRKDGVVGETVTAGTGDVTIKNYTGFVFDDTVTGTNSAGVVNADGSTVLKLYYKRQTCTLTLAAEEGVTVEAQGAAAGTPQTVPSGGQEAIAFHYGESATLRISGTASGRSFVGWYQGDEKKGASTSYRLIMTEDLALTAKSKTQSYEVVVNGTHARSDLPEDCEENIAFGTKKKVALTPDSGYHLPETIDCFVDGQEATDYTYTKEPEASGTVVLTVVGDTELVFAAEPNRYKLILDANGGRVRTEETGKMAEQAELAAVYEAAYGTLPEAERRGYTFLGWFSEKEEAGAEMITAETLHQTAGDRTAYAHWEKKPAGNTKGEDEKKPKPGKPDPPADDIPSAETLPGDTMPRTDDERPGDMSDDIEEEKPDVAEKAAPVSGGIEDSTPVTVKEGGRAAGAVIVTVVCEEEKWTASVTDTLAVANAVLNKEQMQLVQDGETIEIRIDVTDISASVPLRDKEIIESGIEAYKEEMPNLVLGMYIDISMYIKIGDGDWDAITKTSEPIDIVIGIPETLQADGRAYYIIRAHEGEYTFLEDADDSPETITISTSLFSSYAIVWQQADGADTDSDGKCGLCHICPTFLGLCCFIWLAVIAAVSIIIILLVKRKKDDGEEGG